MRRFFFAFAAALSFALLAAAPAAAHATLEQTAPSADSVLDQAPPEVVLTFSEPVDPSLGGVRVFGPDGERVDVGDTSADGSDISIALGSEDRGTYTVAWSVTSEDNHTISGSFVYSVGSVTGRAEISETSSVARNVAGVARWVAFSGSLLFAGLLVFGRVIVSSDRGDAGSPRIKRAALFGAIAAALGALVLLIAQVAVASGRSLGDAVSRVPNAVAETRLGTLGIARTAFALSAIGGHFAVVRGDRGRRTPLVVSIVGAIAAVGLALVPALAGHAWTAEVRLVAVVSDVVHFAAAAVWTGGLVGLLLTRGTPDHRETVRRFSRVALGAVAVVAVTGTISGFLQVRSVDALTGTSYGRLLIVKVVLVVIVVAVGWLNRARLINTLETGRLFTAVRAEVLVLAIVVAVTAALVNRPPARNDLVRPFSATTSVVGGEGAVQAQVQPGRAGTNDVHLYFLGSNGLPAPVDAVELLVGREGVPPRRVDVQPVTADHVSALATPFPTPGTWQLSVTAVREGQTLTATFEVPIR